MSPQIGPKPCSRLLGGISNLFMDVLPSDFTPSVEILHHFETMGNPCLLVFIYWGTIIPGFLRRCRISSIHNRKPLKQGIRVVAACLQGDNDTPMALESRPICYS